MRAYFRISPVSFGKRDWIESNVKLSRTGVLVVVDVMERNERRYAYA